MCEHMPFLAVSFNHFLCQEYTSIPYSVPPYHTVYFLYSTQCLKSSSSYHSLLPQEQAPCEQEMHLVHCYVNSQNGPGIYFFICHIFTKHLLCGRHQLDTCLTERSWVLLLQKVAHLVSFCGCVWWLGPTLPYVRTRQNREADLEYRLELPWASCMVFQLSIAAQQFTPNQVAYNVTFYYFIYFLHYLLLFWKIQSTALSLLSFSFSIKLLDYIHGNLNFKK